MDKGIRPREDFADVDFGARRLKARLAEVVENSTRSAGKSILGSGGGRSEAKAFYRLLGNEKFDLDELQAVCTGSTLMRLSGTVLLIQDTTDINLNGHKKTEGLGYCSGILATSLPLNSDSDVMTIVRYYVQRWKIERFHYILKSGCNAEKIQLRTYERIKPVLLIYSVIALFIMTVTYMGRALPDTLCNLFFDDDEWKFLYRVVHKPKSRRTNHIL